MRNNDVINNFGYFTCDPFEIEDTKHKSLKYQYQEMIDHYESIVVAEKLANIKPTVQIEENIDLYNWKLKLNKGDYFIVICKEYKVYGLQIYIRYKKEINMNESYNLIKNIGTINEYNITWDINNKLSNILHNRLKDIAKYIRSDIILENVQSMENFSYNPERNIDVIIRFSTHPYFQYEEILKLQENYFDIIVKECKNVVEYLTKIH